MRRIPSLTRDLRDLVMFTSGVALLGYLLIMAPGARPTIVSKERSIPVAVTAAASTYVTIQEELGTPLQEELGPPSGRLRNDLRWDLLAMAATSRNRYPSPFAAQAISTQAAAHHGRTLIIPASRTLTDRINYG